MRSSDAFTCTMNDPRRFWSLVFGVSYMAAAAIIGFNIDALWSIYAPAGAVARSHPVLSVLATTIPHALVIAGFVLLIAGKRLARHWFAAVALVPFAYIAVCLIVRAQY